MKSFIKHLFFDVGLWFLLLVCFFNLPYAVYAENALSFLGIFLLILAILCICAFDKVAKDIAKEPKYKPRGIVHKGYIAFTSFAEVAVMAAMGWYWVAAGFALYALVIMVIRTEADKLHGPV